MEDADLVTTAVKQYAFSIEIVQTAIILSFEVSAKKQDLLVKYFNSSVISASLNQGKFKHRTTRIN